MGTHAFADKLKSSLTLSTSLFANYILPLLKSIWISICSFTTSALALKRARESPSFTSILLGRKAFAEPLLSAMTHLYLEKRPVTLTQERT